MKKTAFLSRLSIVFALLISTFACASIAFADPSPDSMQARTLSAGNISVQADGDSDSEAGSQGSQGNSSTPSSPTDPDVSDTPASEPQDPSAGSTETDTAVKKSLAGAQVTATNMTREVPGKAIAPTITLKLDGVTLKQGRDYSLTYNGSTTAPAKLGSYTVCAVGMGDYEGSQTIGSFKIVYALTGKTTKTTISSAKVTATNMTLMTTAGQTVKPQIKLTYSGKALKEGADYRLKYGSSYSAPTASGTYTVYAEALSGGAFSGSVKVGTYKLTVSPFKKGESYLISPVVNSNFMLDAAGKKPSRGSNVSVWTRNGGTNQKWYLEQGSDGYFVIRNAGNKNLVLDAAGNTPKKGSNVSMWTNKVGLNQKWIVEKKNGSYFIRSAANRNLVLDAAGKAPKRGANVSVWSYNGGNNQRWNIKSFSDIYAELDALAKANKNTVKDGTYTLYAPSISGKPVVDVKSGSTANGANVQSASSCASQSQLWQISHVGDYVLVKNAKANKYLSVSNNNSLSGANVVLGQNSNARGAKWIFTKNTDGTYALRSALYTSIVLDIAGAKSKPGTNIQTQSANGSAAQKFSLISTPVNVSKGDTTIDASGYYFIKSAKKSSLFLDVEGASRAENANIDAWSATKLPWQMFRFEQDKGYYRIISALSGKALAVQNSSLVPGANVALRTKSTAYAQLWQAKRNADGTYSFVNRKNGFALQLASSNPKAGTNVNTSWRSSAKAEQSFALAKVTNLMPTGLYNLKSALSSKQSLDVASGSSATSAKIEIWNANDDFAQKWNIQGVSGKTNTYTLQAVCSGKYLADNGKGTAIQTSSASPATSQWSVSLVSGSYVLKNASTNRALDVTNSKATKGTTVATKSVTNKTNQRWNLASTAPIPNGIYLIRSKVNSGKVLDVAGASLSNGANVDMWANKSAGNQKFTLTRNSDGTYTIVNCNSGKALDAAKGKSTPGTNILQYAKNGQKNQRWRAVYCSDGSFKFVSAANPKVVMAFKASTPSNGSNVCLVTDNDSSSQHFTLKKTTPPMPSHQLSMYNRAQGFTSGTNKLILVDRGAHKVGVFSGSKGNWTPIQYWSCVTGAPGSPTITGTYRTTGSKRMNLSTDSRARWCTQIHGGYFFHTILASESELGHSLSHGCIRMAVPTAQWIYHNIGGGTTVSIYN